MVIFNVFSGKLCPRSGFIQYLVSVDAETSLLKAAVTLGLFGNCWKLVQNLLEIGSTLP